MAYQKRYNQSTQTTKTVNCSCGGKAKMRSKKNYPFGRKSKGITSMFYKCVDCQKVTFINKTEGGKR